LGVDRSAPVFRASAGPSRLRPPERQRPRRLSLLHRAPAESRAASGGRRDPQRPEHLPHWRRRLRQERVVARACPEDLPLTHPPPSGHTQRVAGYEWCGRCRRYSLHRCCSKRCRTSWRRNGVSAHQRLGGLATVCALSLSRTSRPVPCRMGRPSTAGRVLAEAVLLKLARCADHSQMNQRIVNREDSHRQKSAVDFACALRPLAAADTGVPSAREGSHPQGTPEGRSPCH